jgi:hypothetical protein
MSDLLLLKNKIELLSKKQHIEILKIIKEESIKFSENNNGIFFNLSTLDKISLDKIRKYITYVSDQEKSLTSVEEVKSNFKKTYFDNKNNIKDKVTNSNNDDDNKNQAHKPEPEPEQTSATSAI